METFTLYEYAAELTYVVDGDTVDLAVDLGFHVKIKDRFRLLGINTPERGQPGYTEAKAFNAAIMAATPQVKVRTHLDATDKYGRMLADIYYPVDGGYASLNQALLDGGLAKVYQP